MISISKGTSSILEYYVHVDKCCTFYSNNFDRKHISDLKLHSANFLVSLGIGCGGFQANIIIQFGIDQLTDALTNEILSFI